MRIATAYLKFDRMVREAPPFHQKDAHAGQIETWRRRILIAERKLEAAVRAVAEAEPTPESRRPIRRGRPR
jgi:hypothetical protein